MVSLQSLLGGDIPPRQVVSILVASYIRAVHWYAPFLHEPSFRDRLGKLLDTKTCSHSDRPFCLLAVCVMLLGLHFAGPDDIHSSTQITSDAILPLRDMFVSCLEKHFLESFDQYNQDWICFSSLLSLYYLLNQRPRRASMVMGAAIQAARDMSLDKAVADTSTTTVLDIEMRKRVWWILFAGDGYVLFAPEN